jgi:hypothetical protein
VTFLNYVGSSLLGVKLLMLIVVCFKFAFYVFVLKIFEFVLSSYVVGRSWSILLLGTILDSFLDLKIL